MAKYIVHFDVRKGNNATGMYTTVEAESDYVAIQLAEAKLKSSNPLHRDYSWSSKKVTKS